MDLLGSIRKLTGIFFSDNTETITLQSENAGSRSNTTTFELPDLAGTEILLSETSTSTNVKNKTLDSLTTTYKDSAKTFTFSHRTAAGAASYTLPETTGDTLVSKTSSDDLTNKTLTAPAINDPVINGGATLTTTSTELNDLAGNAVDASDFTKLSNITASAAEINDLTGNAVDAADFTKLSEITTTSASLNYLAGITGKTTGTTVATEEYVNAGVQVNNETEMKAALLNGGRIRIATAFSTDEVLVVGIAGTTITSDGFFTITSTYASAGGTVLSITASDVTLRDIRIAVGASAHDETSCVDITTAASRCMIMNSRFDLDNTCTDEAIYIDGDENSIVGNHIATGTGAAVGVTLDTGAADNAITGNIIVAT